MNKLPSTQEPFIGGAIINIKNLSKLLKRYPIGNVDGHLDKRKRLIAGIIIGTFFLILIIIGALTGTTGK